MKILLFNQVLSPYNIGLFEKLLHGIDSSAHYISFGFGSDPVGYIDNIRSASIYDCKRVQIKSVDRVSCLSFSWNLLLSCFEYDLVVVEESMIINNILALISRQVFHSGKLVLWGIGKVPGRRRGALRFAADPLMKLVAQHCNAILAYSSYSQKYFSGFTDSRKVFNFMNPFSLGSYREQYLHTSTKQKQYHNELLHLRNSISAPLVVSYVGALEPRKGIEFLLDVWPVLCESVPDALLVIGGTGSLYPFVQSSLCSKRAILLGGTSFSFAHEICKLSDVVVLPGEGGQLINIALNSYTPVVCSDCDGTEVDLVQDGDTGYRFIKNDKNSFIESVLAASRLKNSESFNLHCENLSYSTDKSLSVFSDMITFIESTHS